MAKPQSKTQKKIDHNIRLALTSACEEILKDVDGFQWLTHQANYTNFPASLLVTCIFDTEQNLIDACDRGDAIKVKKRIQAKLLKAGVKFKSLDKQIIFDSEQRCKAENEGDWPTRLARSAALAVPKNRPS